MPTFKGCKIPELSLPSNLSYSLTWTTPPSLNPGGPRASVESQRSLHPTPEFWEETGRAVRGLDCLCVEPLPHHPLTLMTLLQSHHPQTSPWVGQVIPLLQAHRVWSGRGGWARPWPRPLTTWEGLGGAKAGPCKAWGPNPSWPRLSRLWEGSSVAWRTTDHRNTPIALGFCLFFNKQNFLHVWRLSKRES